MARAANPVVYCRNASARDQDQAARVVLAMSGALFSLVGAVLAAGSYLSANGSAGHILIGLALIVSGALVAGRHRAGAGTYLLAFAGTVCWALRNVEVGSSLPQRLAGPAIMLAMIALLMPLLFRWSPRRTATVFAVLITATVVLGISSLPDGPLARRTAAVTQFLDAETKGVLQ